MHENAPSWFLVKKISYQNCVGWEKKNFEVKQTGRSPENVEFIFPLAAKHVEPKLERQSLQLWDQYYK